MNEDKSSLGLNIDSRWLGRIKLLKANPKKGRREKERGQEVEGWNYVKFWWRI